MDYELKDIDLEDIADLLVKVEASFDIKFESNEFTDIVTFGQLCDHIADKIQLDNSDDCTTQQAFYKLRDSISSTLKIENKIISPDLLLADILPRQTRRSGTRTLEKHLGFKLDILRPPYWVTGTLVIILVSSIVGLFFNKLIGLSGLAFQFADFGSLTKSVTSLT